VNSRGATAIPDYTQPEVFLVSRPQIDWKALSDYLSAAGATKKWAMTRLIDGGVDEGELLSEFAGRTCYRSWEPGLNPNVTRVREDREAYLTNVLASHHGSVLEHANYTFAFHHVSRVLTHELVRHRAGTAVSQESMRFVRLTDMPFWMPEWAQEDAHLKREIDNTLARLEWLQKWMANHFDLDNPRTPFAEKKAKTSFMRRLAPDGVATDITWTANIRALRHVITERTAPAAEEEIRLVFGMVAELMIAECPLLFGDFERQDDGTWIPEYRKV
jgi:thymidylate synthase (FAD)